MTQICELTPAELAHYGGLVFATEGLTATAERLIYRALALHSYEPNALASLGHMLRERGAREQCAAVLEYGLADTSPLGPDDRERLEALRAFAQRSWGLTAPRDVPSEADEYTALVSGFVDRAGSLANAFRAALLMVGNESGLLDYTEASERVPADEYFHPNRFGRSALYRDWLAATDDDLAALTSSIEDRSTA
jgi:hypothetical protein